MSETTRFGLEVLFASAAVLAIVLSHRFTERLRIPVPILTLIAAAAAVQLVPSLHPPAPVVVERSVSVALVCILFAGGMHIGRRRFAAAAGPILLTGTIGTLLTTAGAAVVLHVGFGLDWFLSLLVATAVAPTDPAVVFSVLGQREIAGRSGTILEGESGANDPVGIALMVTLLAAGGLGAGAVGQLGLAFALQMAVGLAVGVLGGVGGVRLVRRVSLPNEALYPLRVLAVVFVVYGAATLAQGSGFLAVFVAGIVMGDEPLPHKPEVEHFHAVLASLAEIFAFVVLGLTVELPALLRPDVWIPGLLLGVGLALVIRPLAVGLSLAPSGLKRNERTFVLLAGLKGAVPILLAEFLRAAAVPQAERLYAIVVVVVIFSVAVQGSLTLPLASWLRLPMRPAEPAN